MTTTQTNNERSIPKTPEQQQRVDVYDELAKGVVNFAETNPDGDVVQRVHGLFNTIYGDVAESGLKTSSGQVLDVEDLDDQIALFADEFRKRPEGSDPIDPRTYPDAVRAFPRAKGLRSSIITLLENPSTNKTTLQYLDVIAQQRAFELAHEELGDDGELQTELDNSQPETEQLSADEQYAVLAYKRSVMDKAQAERDKNYSLAARLGEQVYEDRQRLSPRAKKSLGFPEDF